MRLELDIGLGEGSGIWRLGGGEALLDIVTTANVARGFHAGDPYTLRRVGDRAVARAVASGAQVCNRHLAGFGLSQSAEC